IRVPLKCLSEYVDLTLDPGDLARRLTIAGAEVGEVITSGADWDGVTVGRVVDVSRHPNADRLVLATVDLGGEQHTVACGAHHVAAGQKWRSPTPTPVRATSPRSSKASRSASRRPGCRSAWRRRGCARSTTSLT